MIKRGDVHLVEFENAPGQPIQKRRPALIVQNDIGNRYSPATIVAAIRGESGKSLPVHVPLPKGAGGLDKDSRVDCGILVTIDKSELGAKLGSLSSEHLSSVDRALRISLSLG